jgi:hypothetical protein
MPRIRQGVAAGVAKHVGMDLERETGAHGVWRERSEVLLTTDVLHCFPMRERGLHR